MDPGIFWDYAAVYLPEELRFALASGLTLPEHAQGAGLFADVSGFTPLAEALVKAYGLRRGAEELLLHLNRIYDSLIAQVTRFHGSVMDFAGDAITCWFDDVIGEAPGAASGALRAAACALAMQEAMRAAGVVSLPGRSPISLAVKISIASGAARRFLVGDPAIQRIVILVGGTISRLAEGEHLAHRGEILVDAATMDALGAVGQFQREGLDGSFSRLTQLNAPVEQVPWPAINGNKLGEEQLCPWLLPQVYQRLRSGMGEFLTELRPAVALFLRFSGIDFESDPQAGEKLDQLVQQVQGVLAAQEGILVQVTVGDKGSYLYSAFGTPVAHEDDVRRAISTALALRDLCEKLGWLDPVQIGISSGTMRTGAYGGSTRRAYGSLGDDTNLSARLMERAEPGEILISNRIYKAVRNIAGLRGTVFQFEPRPPVQLKGKSDLLPVFSVSAAQKRRAIRLQEPAYALPMIGRKAELALIETKIDLVLQGHGQVVGITGEAGMGKSRLVAEVIRSARRRELVGYGGACQADGLNTPYLVWGPIWQAIFDLNPDAPLRRQVRALESMLEDLSPERMEVMPLLGPLLGLALPDNDFTAELEPQYRRSALEALLLDCLRGVAREAAEEGGGLLLVLEDIHWIDPASHDLLELAARAIVDLPVLILAVFRPTDLQRLQPPRVEALPYYSRIELGELSQVEIEQVVSAKLAQLYPEMHGTPPGSLITRVIAQAQGNPFYADELLNYLHDQDVDIRNAHAIQKIELPSSLHSLVLSRIDQLSGQQQLVLKVASIIGRQFRFDHLYGYYPTLGDSETVRADLKALTDLQLTLIQDSEPELSYLFRNIITYEVAYENLPVATRMLLHELYAGYLEELAGENLAPYLDLLAFHYDRSGNPRKKRLYLRLAGEAAAARFANTEALEYLTRVLALTPKEELPERYELYLGRESVLATMSARNEWRQDLEVLNWLARRLDAQDGGLRSAVVAYRWAIFYSNGSDYNGSIQAARHAIELARASNDSEAIRLEAEACSVWGWSLTQQGDYTGAQPILERSLELARSSGNDRVIAVCLTRLGMCRFYQGNHREAIDLLSRALQVNREEGNKPAEAITLINLGVVYAALMDTSRCREYGEQALAIHRNLGNRAGEMIASGNLYVVYAFLGDLATAHEMLEKALQLSREVGAKGVEGVWLTSLGEMAFYEGDYTAAQDYCTQALSLHRLTGMRGWEMFDTLELWLAAWSLGDYALAAELASQRENVQRQLEDAGLDNYGLQFMALSLRSLSNRQAAQAALNDVQRLCAGSQDPAALGTVQLVRGVLMEEWAAGRAALLEGARGAYAQAAATYNRISGQNVIMRNCEMESRAGLARVALAQGDLPAALAQVEKILGQVQTCPLLYGAREPLRIYHTVYQVLSAAGDPGAQTVLEAAQSLLENWSSKIKDASTRHAFLENVPINRDLMALRISDDQRVKHE